MCIPLIVSAHNSQMCIRDRAHPHSNASESVLSHIATAKYYDHLPLYRQLDIFEREGIHLSPSTVSNWMMAAAQRLEPIYNELRELVRCV